MEGYAHQQLFLRDHDVGKEMFVEARSFITRQSAIFIMVTIYN